MNKHERPGGLPFAILPLLLTAGAASFGALPGTMLGPYPRLAPEAALQETARAAPAPPRAAALAVDPADRAAVLAFYHCVYLASEGFETRMEWQGDVARCAAGTVTEAFHEDTLRRINYFRAMAGLNADVTLDPDKNAKCQEAALIMARNDGLSHSPILEQPTWACLTPAGDEAASKSNLSLGAGLDYTGPRAVDGQMEDAGDFNTAVGHRRWLLYPRARVMGNGGIPFAPSHASSAAVWVIGAFAPPPAGEVWVSWPNAGYVPYPVVYPRWSFSLRGADFSGATVTMTCGGAAVPLLKIHPTAASPAVAGVGDPTIVWEPQDMAAGAPAADTTYTVTIQGVAGATRSTYSYSVTIFDPYALEEPVVITGPGAPARGGMNLYSLTPVAGADSYLVRARALAAATWTEGAEAAPPPRVIDRTSPDYALLSQDLARTGARSFHLAFPDFEDQRFEIDRVLLPGQTSRLNFHYRRRFSSTANTLACEVAAQEGGAWQELWSVAGVCGQSCDSGRWDPTWLPASVSLAAYQGQPIRVRFALDHNGTAYIGATGNYGIFIDDIEVADVEEPRSQSVFSVDGAGGGFVFQPDSLAPHLLDAAVRIGCFESDYGPYLRVAPVEQTAIPQVRITWLAMGPAELRLGIGIDGGVFAALALERADRPAGPWQAEPAARYDPFGAEFTLPHAGPQAPGFLRVVGMTP